MKLSKAREILKLNVKKAGPKMPPDTLEALKLGIEALKRLQTMRVWRSAGTSDPLPGETQED